MGPLKQVADTSGFGLFDDTGRMIAHVNIDIPEPDRFAWADLLAAAPALLDALEKCLETIQGHVINGRTGKFAEDAARAAIAKAKGTA